MKNRDRYIVKRNEYDLMMAIEKNTGICPIRIIANISREQKIKRCYRFLHLGCAECVQQWLNEGEGMEQNNTCVCCGSIIPEGRQVCPKCEKSSDETKCECWQEGHWFVKDGSGTCNGTRERDPCNCGGIRSKCDFYPEVREKAKQL